MPSQTQAAVLCLCRSSGGHPAHPAHHGPGGLQSVPAQADGVRAILLHRRGGESGVPACQNPEEEVEKEDVPPDFVLFQGMHRCV